ncbi:hypothetical protein ACFLVP_03635 [Chloroflexota bacterium]
MAKQSRRTAASYAMKSRVKKTPSRPNIVGQYPVDSDVSDNGYAVGVIQAQEQVNSTYRYVVSDLRRMGILIGGVAVVLVILTIFLR